MYFSEASSGATVIDIRKPFFFFSRRYFLFAEGKPECCNETGEVKNEAEPKAEAAAAEVPEAAPAPAGGESAAPADAVPQDGASS